ncbi:MAG: MFS transporter [Gammaproteobacteria bacterium]|jgi:Na+/melibiose symporter-like transporter|nr:MFS transporter [Gammaproteobacteria bacterium]
MAEVRSGAAPSGGHKPLSSWVLASYGAPAMPLAMVTLPMAVYLPAVYADSEGFGLGLAFVGLMMVLSRVFDGITDPLIGFLSDRTRSRWGRRKPFVLLGTPIYIFGICMLFIPPIEFTNVTLLGFTFNSGYPWMLATLVITYVGATIKDVPYSAWGAELSKNYNERTLITSWREGFSVSGSLIGAFTPAIIFFFGYDKPTDAVFFLALAITFVMPVLIANCLISTPEHPPVEVRKTRLPLKESFTYVWQNEPYRRLVIIFLFSTIGSAMTNTLSFFFVKHVLLAGDLYGFYLAPYFVSQIVAIPLWFKLSRRVGKHRATMWAIGWYALWSCFIPLIAIAPMVWFEPFAIPHILAFLPPDAYASSVAYFEGIPTGKFLFFIIIMCLKGSAIGALTALPYAMAADVVDVDSARTGKSQGGAYFSIWLMTRKLAYALGLFVGTNLVVLFGFNSLADPMDTTNTTFALLMLAVTYSVIPAVFKFVAMPLLWNYPLTEERVHEIQAEIEAGKAEARPPPIPVPPAPGSPGALNPPPA